MPAALVLMTGRSFSGKSTIAARIATVVAGTVIALDAINDERGLHGGMGIPVEEWWRTNLIAQKRVEALLAGGKIAVVDDTSSPRFLRDHWRTLADRSGARFVLLYVDADRETILRRLHENRSVATRRDVADAVMREHLASYEPPEDDEPMIVVAADMTAQAVVEAMRRSMQT